MSVYRTTLTQFCLDCGASELVFASDGRECCTQCGKPISDGAVFEALSAEFHFTPDQIVEFTPEQLHLYLRKRHERRKREEQERQEQLEAQPEAIAAASLSLDAKKSPVRVPVFGDWDEDAIKRTFHRVDSDIRQAFARAIAAIRKKDRLNLCVWIDDHVKDVQLPPRWAALCKRKPKERVCFETAYKCDDQNLIDDMIDKVWKRMAKGPSATN